MALAKKTDKRAAAAAFKLTIAEGRKGPQIRPPPDERARFWGAQYEMKYNGRRTSFKRHTDRFCIRPLDQLRGLPLATEDSQEEDGQSACGVYFLWYGPELVYIGKSVGIGYRLFRHKEDGKVFTHATYLRGPSELIRDFEADHVRKYRPPLNMTSTG